MSEKQNNDGLNCLAIVKIEYKLVWRRGMSEIDILKQIREKILLPSYAEAEWASEFADYTIQSIKKVKLPEKRLRKIF